VRPDHLFLGDQQTNIDDMWAKDRSVYGERSATAKVTEQQVIEMRARYAAGGILLRELGAEYGISGSQVGLIVRRKSWAHIL
jgi:hypothetical protein